MTRVNSKKWTDLIPASWQRRFWIPLRFIHRLLLLYLCCRWAN